MQILFKIIFNTAYDRKQDFFSAKLLPLRIFINVQ